TTIVCILVMAPAMWVLAFSCVVILEAAEAQSEELERLVRRDPLTGLGNRRLLDEQLSELLRRHELSGQQLSVLALDLNGFKALNDTLGHAAGDELLRDTATALERATRPQDVLIRQGGDEFLVLLPNTSPEHAQRTTNAIRAGLASTDTGGLVSSGIGRATYPDDALTGDVLLHVADERLIADKASGPKRGVKLPATNPFDRAPDAELAPDGGPRPR
ncbi:MAG: GGDEF domain-containing protein, partial [Patulibacter sp.]|nr:GGDEF domain-containing protein [Patulibacter sp.]